MTLYELNEAINNFEWQIDEKTGEILNAADLDAIALARDEKIEQLGLWVKDLNAEAEALKKEKENLAQRERQAQRKAESVKGYLAAILNGHSYKTTRVAFNWRKSTAGRIGRRGRMMEQVNCSNCMVCAFKDNLCTSEICDRFRKRGNCEDFEGLLMNSIKCGRWIIEPGIGCKCTACGFDIGNDLDFMEYVKYCPACGAKMEEQEGD